MCVYIRLMSLLHHMLYMYLDIYCISVYMYIDICVYMCVYIKFMSLLHHLTSFAVSSSYAKTGVISHSPIVYHFLVYDIRKKKILHGHIKF